MIKEKRTYAERRKYNIESVTKRRKKIRFMAIEKAGSKCIRCGYDKYLEVLEFHHRDPSKKEFGIGQNGLTRSWKRVEEEIKKCDLLCANCHREQHIQERKRLNSRLSKNIF